MARSIVMPSFGMYTAEGTLLRWLLPTGTRVEVGDALLEIETEKSVLEVTAPEAGLLCHATGAGARVQVESLLGYVLADGEPPPSADTTRPDGPTKHTDALTANAPSQAATRDTITPPASVTSAAALPNNVAASPVARRLAAQYGIDLSRVTGTGPGGRVVEADVAAAIRAARQQP